MCLISKALIRELSTSLAQEVWLCSLAFVWRPARSQSPPSRPALSWRPITLARAVTETRTRRNPCTFCAVSHSNLFILCLDWHNKSSHDTHICYDHASTLLLACQSTFISRPWRPSFNWLRFCVLFPSVFWLNSGASSGTVELLPSPSSITNWTAGLPTDNGHDSDQVFEFNGTQAVKVPDGVVSTSLKEPFTVSVWMRHGPGSREKETILCNSDKTGKRKVHHTIMRLVFGLVLLCILYNVLRLKLPVSPL